jgi:hypothetical protein
LQSKGFIASGFLFGITGITGISGKDLFIPSWSHPGLAMAAI